MQSIKEKIARMLQLAEGKLITHHHARQAGILVKDIQLETAGKKQPRKVRKSHPNSLKKP